MRSITRLRNAPRMLGAFACALLLHPSATSAGALAQGGGYELQPDVVGAGGTTMHGGTWTLDGTVAQADALVQNGAAGVRLAGGFWRATKGAIVNDRIFANGFD